ncbi:MAG: AMP-binding protein [Marinifilaceae bacterium]|jgi:O-succinylbenzoic acid--CoA ligase|nr:AMP-binding protein [Marinifilaceae bacterium]
MYTINGIDYSKEELIDLAKKKVQVLNDWEKDFYNFILEWFNHEDFVSGHTSGTTGNPKSISLNKSNMIDSAKRTMTFFNLKKRSNLLLCLSTDYIAGKMMVVRALEFGMNLITIPPTISDLLNLNINIDLVALVPYQMSKLIKKKSIMDNIGFVLLGGAAANNSLLKEIQSINTQVYATYGMTETLSHIALKKINGDLKSDLFSILPGVSISIDDRDCLIVKVFGKTFITNDIIRLVDDNRFEWLGRYDNVINSGGLKFIPEQIESKLQYLIKYRYYISSEKDNDLGNIIVLYIESEKFSIEKEDSLFEEMRKVLSKYEIPKSIYYLDSFSETSNGKLIRN